MARAQAPQEQQPPPIRVRVELVDVGVTITDSHGRFIEGLHREDFHVFDNGLEQPLASFVSIAEPAQVVLLIECGPAVYLLGKSHLQAASNLLSALTTGDRVAVACYSKATELVLDFTTDKSAARLALDNLNFIVGFGELNLSSSLVTTIEWLAAMRGKKTIVLLSTGIDTSRAENWRFIEQKLKTSDIRILAVSLSGYFRKPVKGRKLSREERLDRAFVKQGFAVADRWLREVSETTGGRVYFPKNAKEFRRAYAQIAQLVRHEYSLAFKPPVLDGRLHFIEVRVKRSAYRVSHRQAYLAPTDSK